MPIKRKGEKKNEFISRCIKTEMDSGYPQDQAIAICYSKWQKMDSDEKTLEASKKLKKN